MRINFLNTKKLRLGEEEGSTGNQMKILAMQEKKANVIAIAWSQSSFEDSDVSMQGLGGADGVSFTWKPIQINYSRK